MLLSEATHSIISTGPVTLEQPCFLFIYSGLCILVLFPPEVRLYLVYFTMKASYPISNPCCKCTATLDPRKENWDRWGHTVWMGALVLFLISVMARHFAILAVWSSTGVTVPSWPPPYPHCQSRLEAWREADQGLVGGLLWGLGRWHMVFITIHTRFWSNTSQKPSL